MKARHISPSQAAAAMGISRQRVHQLLKAGRFPDAEQLYPGGPWIIGVHNGKIRCPKGKPGRPAK